MTAAAVIVVAFVGTLAIGSALVYAVNRLGEWTREDVDHAAE